MRRAAIIFGILTVGIVSTVFVSEAQDTGQPAQQTPPASQAATAPAPVAPPKAKRPPQAKTQQEFDAYKVAIAVTDPAAMEKAAIDFAAKFPDSEIRILLYQSSMRLYQTANNGEKTETMGRKVLGLDPDNPEALIAVAGVIAERTRDTDIDKDQQFGEAITMAQKSTQTVDTDLGMQAGTPQERIDAAKSLLRSQAYSILGTIEFKKEDYPAAQENLQKSIDIYPSDPSAVDILRLALALDKQQKYPEALKAANRAVELTQDNTPIGTPARRERDRLQQLTGAAAPAQSPTPPPTPAQPQTPPQTQTPPKN